MSYLRDMNSSLCFHRSHRKVFQRGFSKKNLLLYNFSLFTEGNEIEGPVQGNKKIFWVVFN